MQKQFDIIALHIATFLIKIFTNYKYIVYNGIYSCKKQFVFITLNLATY